GRADVVTNVKLLLGQPDGSLALSQTLPPALFPYGEAAGDFDGDGLIDVVAGRPMGLSVYPSTVLFLRGHGDGTVQTTGLQTGPVPGDLGGMAVGDFNNDGRADLAAVGATNQQGMARLSVLLNATYGAGSPFLDLGGNTVGTNGSPIQIASGTLVAG